MNFFIPISKLKRKIWGIVVSKTNQTSWSFLIYKAYWHSLFYKNNKQTLNNNYLASVPNPGAGIGHQMANWIAGYWFSTQFFLKFAHVPFTGNNWEEFLGFGEKEEKVNELLLNGYKRVLLPLFDEYNNKQLEIIRNIIKSYCNRKVVFITEQDQGYKDQYGIVEQIKNKFYNSSNRINDKLIFDASNFNIAVHIRRGDITVGQVNGNVNLKSRWQNNDYFINVLKNVLTNLNQNKPVSIYLFSQGEIDDLADFRQFGKINYCLDMTAKQSFLHMVFADLLITSKSSFSYKPALISNGIKVCPKLFWHGYPVNKSWILADEEGSFSQKEL